MLGGQGADFLRGVAFWSIRCAGLLILRDRCITSYDLASTFRGRRRYFRQVDWKIAKRIARVCQLCTQLSIFEGKSRRISSFLMSLHFEKMRKSRRIASFRMLSSSKKMKTSHRIVPFWTFLCSNITEVSQNFLRF